MMHWKYLKAVLRHKKFVLLAGWGTVPLRRLIIHDWSKFTPAEWFPYARKFYGGHYPTEAWCNTIGVPFVGARPLTRERVDAEFDRAWLHHQHANDHHWQHYVLRLDDGGTTALEMPEDCAREMLADWRGAGRAILGEKADTAAWYAKNAANMLLHPMTKAWIEAHL